MHAFCQYRFRIKVDFFSGQEETRKMWSEMQLNYGWIDVLRETFVSQSLSQWFSKWGKGNLWGCYASKRIWHREHRQTSFLQCYRSVEILCSQTENTVVYVKERAQFEAKDEKLLVKYVRNTCTTCKLSYSLFLNIIFPWFTTGDCGSCVKQKTWAMGHYGFVICWSK